MVISNLLAGLEEKTKVEEGNQIVLLRRALELFARFCLMFLPPECFRRGEVKGFHALRVKQAAEFRIDNVVDVVTQGSVAGPCEFEHLSQVVGRD